MTDSEYPRVFAEWRKMTKMTDAKMEKIAFDLVTMPTTKAVVEKNKISHNTLTKLRRDHRFQQLLIETRTRIYEEAIDKATSDATAAVERLIKIAKDKKAPATARVNADKAVLEIALDYYRDRKIYDRLEIIEEEIEIQRDINMNMEYWINGQPGTDETAE